MSTGVVVHAPVHAGNNQPQVRPKGKRMEMPNYLECSSCGNMLCWAFLPCLKYQALYQIRDSTCCICLMWWIPILGWLPGFFLSRCHVYEQMEMSSGCDCGEVFCCLFHWPCYLDKLEMNVHLESIPMKTYSKSQA